MELANLELECLGLAQRLIRIPSLTAVTPNLREAAMEPLNVLQAFLEGHGAQCQTLTFEGGHPVWGYPVDNLFAEWKGNAALGHLCFIGHTDVVAPGDLAAWRANPFSGDVRHGFLHGRGATDMKGAVAAFCTAAAFAHAAPASRPQVSIVITSDEEWAAVNGTRKVLEWMRAAGHSPNAFLIGEPSSPSRFGTHIKAGRRGSLCGTISAKGVQGHAAYSGLYENPNRALNLALTLIHAHRWDDAPPGMPATNFETIAQNAGDFSQTAIVPGTASALWNIRFTPAQNVDCLLAKLRNLLVTIPEWATNHCDSEQLAAIEIIGNIETASMPYYSPPSRFAKLVSQAVSAETGCIPAVDASGGTTDGRFVHSVFPDAEIVELGLPENGGADGAEPAKDRGGMHQVDERCAVGDLGALARTYHSILHKFAARP